MRNPTLRTRTGRRGAREATGGGGAREVDFAACARVEPGADQGPAEAREEGGRVVKEHHPQALGVEVGQDVDEALDERVVDVAASVSGFGFQVSV